MVNLEELAQRVLKFEVDLDWYNVYDNYGNVETDEEARNTALEEILNTLTNNPQDIINNLKETLEELDEEHECYQETKDLINEIEELNGLQDNIEI